MNEAFIVDNTQNMTAELARLYRDWVPKINEAMAAYFPRHPEKAFLAQDLGEGIIDSEAASKSLFDPTYLYVDRPGKLLRPVLTGLVLDAYDVDISRHMPVLAMIELMEATTISLNDVWDESTLRRGGPCTHVLHGHDVAYVAALFGYSYCQKFLFNPALELDDATRLRLYRAFAFEDMQFFLGDLVETLWPIQKKKWVEENHYFQEVVSRCAFLSFRGPTRIGAILGKAPENDIHALEAFGMRIGLAYHLRGDNLNFNPQSNTWGKAHYEDITAGRRSLVTSYAYLQASVADRAEMLAILDASTTDVEKLNQFIALIQKYHASEYCETRARTLISEAKAELEHLSIQPYHRNLLEEFADFMVDRTK